MTGESRVMGHESRVKNKKHKTETIILTTDFHGLSRHSETATKELTTKAPRHKEKHKAEQKI